MKPKSIAFSMILVFLSGVAGLVYQVLWMKQLGLLFGNTSHAAGATLSAFFGGLAVGSWFWGRRMQQTKNPMRIYALLEVGIAVTALLYFGIMAGYYHIYPPLFQAISSKALLLCVKFGLALILVFPPAFCMGGTIPVMGQVVIRQKSSFGWLSALLYSLNTLGAAIGALLAGFCLPLWIGFKLTCVAAMCITCVVAAGAFLMSRNEDVADEESTPEPKPSTETEDVSKNTGAWVIYMVCFFSGFSFLALEVLWTRMFAQVWENSVYTYAAILVIVLVCLTIGAAVSSGLSHLSARPVTVLTLLIILSGVAVAATPFVFVRLTNGLKMLQIHDVWTAYIALVFKTCFLAIGLPAILLGAVFPYLMKTSERHVVSAGKTLGRLSSVNTLGAVLGSLLCGFVFLEWLGMWRTMQLITLGYFALALAMPLSLRGFGIAGKVCTCGLILLMLTKLDPTGLPITGGNRKKLHEKTLKTWEGSDCTVAVVSGDNGMATKVNSHYGLGSTGARVHEALQTQVPLYANPKVEDIFYLGLGTGITAGEALSPRFPSVKRVVTCELVPEVITAAKEYITNVNGQDYTNGLFTDPRSIVLTEDGRHFLMAANERYDLVNGDLFVPYRSGAGSLFTREHFTCVKSRLKPGGTFFQWLPLYQLTENEFSIITRTMLEVFPQVSLWRNDFQPGREVVAVVGHADKTPLPACEIDCSQLKQRVIQGMTSRDLPRVNLPINKQTVTLYYCGNLTASRSLFDKYPVNTDDLPLIEYLAPRTFRNKTDVTIPWFIGPLLADLVDQIQEKCPPETDPLLVNRSPANKRLARAGAAFHYAQLWYIMKRPEECRASWEKFVREWMAK